MDRALPTIVIRGLTLGYSLEQLEKGLLWFSHTVYRELFERATTVFLSVNAPKTLKNIERRMKKNKDSSESTLLSLHMIQNLRYLPDGEKLTNKTKKRLVAKLQETYVTSYHHYFAHHPGITVDSNQDEEIVFQQINSALFPVKITHFTRRKLTSSKKEEKVLR